MNSEKEDPKKIAAFEAKIEAEKKIEPNDWMPEAYRQHLIRQMSQHAPLRSNWYAT